jgi:hypothetical protein
MAKYADLTGALFRQAMELKAHGCRRLMSNLAHLLRICCPPIIVDTLHPLMEQFTSFFVSSSSSKNPFLAVCEQIALRELGLEAAKV